MQFTLNDFWNIYWYLGIEIKVKTVVDEEEFYKGIVTFLVINMEISTFKIYVLFQTMAIALHRIVLKSYTLICSFSKILIYTLTCSNEDVSCSVCKPLALEMQHFLRNLSKNLQIHFKESFKKQSYSMVLLNRYSN